jgi:hypothetical protein
MRLRRASPFPDTAGLTLRISGRRQLWQEGPNPGRQRTHVVQPLPIRATTSPLHGDASCLAFFFQTVAQNLDVDRFLFPEQFEADANSFVFCVDRKFSHLPDRAQLCVDRDSRRESQDRVFRTMKNISQAFRSRSSQSVYDSRQPLLIRRQQLAISPCIAKP